MLILLIFLACNGGGRRTNDPLDAIVPSVLVAPQIHFDCFRTPFRVPVERMRMRVNSEALMENS